MTITVSGKVYLRCIIVKRNDDYITSICFK